MNNKKWVLIAVSDDIYTTIHDSLCEAQQQMLNELENYGGVIDPILGMKGSKFGINAMDAWSDIGDEVHQQWKIISVE